MSRLNCSQALAALIPHGVAAIEVWDRGQRIDLHPEDVLAAGAVASRRREFALGRWCARQAMMDLGQGSAFVGVNADRSPRWPEGLIGSISHTSGYVGALVADARRFRAVGFDAERLGRLPAVLWRNLFTPVEIERLLAASEVDQDFIATLMFSAKEAYYKAQFPASGRWMDFHDVLVEWDAGTFWVSETRTSHGPTQGAYALCDGVVITAIVSETLLPPPPI